MGGHGDDDDVVIGGGGTGGEVTEVDSVVVTGVLAGLCFPFCFFFFFLLTPLLLLLLLDDGWEVVAISGGDVVVDGGIIVGGVGGCWCSGGTLDGTDDAFGSSTFNSNGLIIVHGIYKYLDWKNWRLSFVVIVVVDEDDRVES